MTATCNAIIISQERKIFKEVLMFFKIDLPLVQVIYIVSSIVSSILCVSDTQNKESA